MSINIRGMMSSIATAQNAEPELAKLKKATDGFESVFLKKLFSQMRSSVQETRFGQTFGKEIYDDMFNEAMANAAAKSNTLGMGDMLYKQFAPRVVQQVHQEQLRELRLSASKPSSTPLPDQVNVEPAPSTATAPENTPRTDLSQPGLPNRGLSGPIGQIKRQGKP